MVTNAPLRNAVLGLREGGAVLDSNGGVGRKTRSSLGVG